MFPHKINSLGIILISVALFLSAIPFVRPNLFQRQDILLIIVFFICGLIFLFQNRLYSQGLTQFNLILLIFPAVFYTFESLRLRNRKNQNKSNSILNSSKVRCGCIKVLKCGNTSFIASLAKGKKSVYMMVNLSRIIVIIILQWISVSNES